MDRAAAMKIMRREKIIRQYRWEALGVQAVAGRVTFAIPGQVIPLVTFTQPA